MSQSLVILRNISQTDILHGSYPDLLRNSLIISLDLDVSARLAIFGYTFRELTEFISIEELFELSGEAERLLHVWYAPWEELTLHQGYSPLRTDYLSMYSTFVEALAARELFLRLIAHAMPSSIVLFENLGQPNKLWEGPKPDVIQAIWRYLADRQIIPTIIIPNTRIQLGVETLSLPAKINHYWGFISAWLGNPHRKFLMPPLSSPQEVDVLFAISPWEARRYSPIIRKLKSYFGDKLLNLTTDSFHRFNIDLPDGRVEWQTIPALNPFDIFWHAKQRMKAVYKTWLEGQVDYSGPYPEIFANRYLNFQFRYIFEDRLPQVMQIYQTALAAFKAIKPKIVATVGYSFYFQAEILEAARRLGIQTVTMPHSGHPTTLHETLFGDKSFVWDAGFLYTWGKSADDEFVITGIPTEIIHEGYLQPDISATPLGSAKTIVVVVCPISDEIIPRVAMEAHRKTLLTLASVPEHLRGRVQVIFKLHPALDYQYVYEYLRSLSPSPESVHIIHKANLMKLIQQADITVMPNIPSSSYLSAIDQKIPLLYLRSGAMPFSMFALADWSDEAAVRSDDAIWPKMERILFSQEGRSQILDANQRYWKRIVPDDTDPIEVMFQAFTAMLRSKA